MPVAFREALQVALDQILRDSNVPGRRPSHQMPPFWAYPITKTGIRPLAAGNWNNFLEITGEVGWWKRIGGYVATTFGDQTISDVAFRFILNGAIVPYIRLANDVDHNKISATTFPVIFQPTFFLLGQGDRLIVQARNTGVFQQMVCAALVGWRFESAVGPDKNEQAMTTDVT